MTCRASMVAEDYLDDDAYCCGWREGSVAGRKDHRCHECIRVIPKGERHEFATGCVTGEGWRTWRRCMECVVLAEMIAMKMDLCVPWGALANFCEDYQDDERHPWLRMPARPAAPVEIPAGVEEGGK